MLRRKPRRRIFPNPRIIALALLVLPAALIAVTASRVEDLVVELALSEATDSITITVNDVISAKVMDGSINYAELITLEKDNSGVITALTTNMANINALQADITNSVVTQLIENNATDVSVPLGSFLGSTLLSGHGPRLNLHILSVTNVETKVKNEFTSAGINQTLHQIMLEVDVSLGILLSGYTNYWSNVQTEMTVAETVIVGRVPESYASFK